MSAANERVEVEVWVVVDADGNHAVGEDADAAGERYADNIGGGDGTAKRVVKVTLTVPLPKPVELVGVVAEERAGGELRAV